MKTKITAAIFFAFAFTSASAQNSWKPEPTNKYYVPETPAQVVSRSETYFGADLEYTEQGGKIINVVPNSPAESHYFRNGDIITSIGDVAINSEASYKQALEANKPDEYVKVSFIRKGAQKQRKVKLDKITVYKNAGS